MSDDLLTPKGRRTRQSLVNAATEVFVRKGLFDARIADITEAAGVSPAAFYRYFETKNDILGEAVDIARDSTLSALRPGGDEERSAAVFDRFARANRRYLEAYRENANVIRMLEQRIAIDDGFRVARRDWHPAFVRRLEAGLRRLQDQGQIGREVDVFIAGPTLAAMVENLAYVHLVLRGDDRLPPHVERTIHMMWGNMLDVPWEVSQLPNGLRRPRPMDVTECTPLARTAPPPQAVPAPSSRKGVMTRTRLLKAARTVFEQHGYLDTRVADIAAQARVAHGTFYNYFESRFDVFCALAASLADDLSEFVRTQRMPARGLWDTVHGDIVSAAEFYERNVRMFAVLEQFASIDSDAAAFRLLIRARFVTQWARAIKRLQVDGQVDGRLAALPAASALVSTFDRSMFEWYVLDVPRSNVNTAESLASVLMQALVAARD